MYWIKITAVTWFEIKDKKTQPKTLQLIEFSHPLLNHPNSTGLLRSCVNTTANIHIFFHWQEKTCGEL